MIKTIFFDVANTLLEKPNLFTQITTQLENYGYSVSVNEVRYVHKMISEAYVFPDRTSIEFYTDFNLHFLYALGIAPTEQLIKDLFEACTYMEWTPFDDTMALHHITLPIGILSNWDSSLKNKLARYFTIDFKWVLCSQDEGIRKPNPLFFQKMVEYSGFQAAQILFVGDSLKFDVHPALKLGIPAVLIDRHNHFPGTNVPRIQHLNDLIKWL